MSVKLLPPYCKPGEPGEFPLELPDDRWDLRRLAEYLDNERRNSLGFALLDSKGFLTAEFLVNGTHVPDGRVLQENDLVTVIPYICGG
ncbi:MAG: hypothetical protein AB1767_02680 [Bacillota bacterium]